VPVKQEQNVSRRDYHGLARNLDSGSVLGLRRALRRLRTIYWFEGLRLDAGVQKAYALGRIVQPETYRKRRNYKPKVKKRGMHRQTKVLPTDEDITEANHNNLWAKYQVGDHAPKPALRQRADAQFPGSALRFTDPLFDAIDPQCLISDRSDALLRHLQPEVVRAVFDNKELSLGLFRRRKSLPQTLNLLEKLSTPDALTALIVLVREAHERGEQERMLAIQQRLYSVFLVVCASSAWYEARYALALALDRWVFQRTPQTEWCWVIDGSDCFRSIRLLRHAFVQIKTRTPAHRVSKQLARRLTYYVRGLFGLDYYYALSPARALTVAPTTASPAVLEAVVEHQAFMEWAWRSLVSGQGGALGTQEVRDLVEAWKADGLLHRIARTNSSVQGGWSGSL
jgi:hypothetical protein